MLFRPVEKRDENGYATLDTRPTDGLVFIVILGAAGAVSDDRLRTGAASETLLLAAPAARTGPLMIGPASDTLRTGLRTGGTAGWRL